MNKSHLQNKTNEAVASPDVMRGKNCEIPAQERSYLTSPLTLQH